MNKQEATQKIVNFIDKTENLAELIKQKEQLESAMNNARHVRDAACEEAIAVLDGLGASRAQISFSCNGNRYILDKDMERLCLHDDTSFEFLLDYGIPDATTPAASSLSLPLD